jgi:hypothetical protein
VVLLDGFPRVRLHALERQADAQPLGIDVEDDDLDLLADLDDIARVALTSGDARARSRCCP